MTEHRRPAVVISCEHGGNQVPAEWRYLFPRAEPVLNSHRGYDPGALELARKFSAALQVPLTCSTVSRLLIELNRSSGHPQLFSEFSRPLSRSERQRLMDQYYLPYRTQVRRNIDLGIQAAGRVIHLSVHSFTPIWEGRERPIDVGLLYDPGRPLEKSFCGMWRQELQFADGNLRLRRNAPYKGTADGLVTSLRKSYQAKSYAGIELEVNQRFPLSNRSQWLAVQDHIVDSFVRAIDKWS